jgi:hypothetical protein
MAFARPGGSGGRPPQEAFQAFEASELFCPRCRRARRVRERLLLVLPDGELTDYVCTACGTSLGSRRTEGPTIVR